ncbi:MAG TPA: aminomethyltransferase beta-barrel domain-containing protein [Acidimicrobiales bacterium]
MECNRHLKFDALLARAEQLGFDAVATGHHAQVQRVGDRCVLARGADRAKDQSYVLHMLDQRSLAQVLLPVGHLTKAQVREQAAALGLRTAAKPDSQEVCFITSTSGREGFLKRRLELHPGTVVDTDGRRVGEVDAVELLTVGQRRGLGGSGGGRRLYVVDVDVPARRVVVGPAAALRATKLVAGPMSWVHDPVSGELLVQCSAHGTPQPATVTPDGDQIVVTWHEPQRRVAPGQSVVLYDLGDRQVLGGAPALS